MDPKDVDNKTKEAIVAAYIGSSKGRSKLADAMIEPIRRRLYGTSDGTRCPHDGRYCSRFCEDRCERETAGESLDSPITGYPINSKQYFDGLMIRRVIDG
jgi:hypothetical protein